MESKDGVANKETVSKSEAAEVANSDKINAKLETTSLKNEPTQKKSFFRFFSLRTKKSVKIDIPLENKNEVSDNNDKEVEKSDEIQVVDIEECVTTDIDKVKCFSKVWLPDLFCQG